MTRKVTAALGWFSLFAIFLATSVPAAEVTLRVGHGYADGQPQDEAIKLFRKRLEELSNGKATLQLFGNNSLGNDVQLIEGVLAGAIDITVVANGPVTNFVPEMKIFDMPFMFLDYAHLNKAVSGPLFDEVAKATQAKGMRLLGILSSGERHIMTKRPVTGIADLKGMKIRTLQNPVHLETFKAFGANPIAIAYGELYGALQTGVVDGAEAANNNYLAAKFYEVANQWAVVGWTHLTADILVSDKKFASLPSDVQQALAQAGKDSAAFGRELIAKTENALLEPLKKAGVSVTTLDAAPFRSSVKPVYEKFLTTDAEKRLHKLVQDVQ